MTNKKQTKSLAEAIESCKFNWVNPDIEKHFILEPSRSTDHRVFHFGRVVSSEDAAEDIKREGYLPANLTELLQYAVNGWEGQDWVVALGSVAGVSGRRFVPCLYVDDRERRLDLDWWDGGWGGGCRFLAVRNSDSGTKTSEKELGTSDSLSLKTLEARISKLEKLFEPKLLK